MKLMNNVSKEEKKLIRKMFWRSGAMYASVNPVTMGGGGFCYSMIPFINHFYKDNEEKRREALVRHVKYFSTTIPMASFVMGIAGSMEKENSEKIDVLFLDIAMGDIDGMSVAKQLRQIQADKEQAAWGSLPLLIFVTGYSEYMPDAFSVNAFQYIVKPIKKKDFVNVFTQAVREYQTGKEITVGNGANMQTIKADDIFYIESSNHKIFICLEDKKIEHWGKISDLEQELNPEFFRIHKGYLVNLKQIEGYDRTEVCMKNGNKLLISKYKYQDFVKAYLQYISEES